MRNKGFAHVLVILAVIALVLVAIQFSPKTRELKPTPTPVFTTKPVVEQEKMPIEPEIKYAVDEERSTVTVKYGTSVFVADNIKTDYFLSSEYKEPGNLKWKEFPVKFKSGESGPGRVLNVKKFPNKYAFLISVYGDSLVESRNWGDVRQVYAIGYEGASEREPILTFADNTDTPWHPFIRKISNNGKVAVIDLGSCSECDGGYLGTMLLKLDLDGESKRKEAFLGEITDLTINDDNSYSYRAYPKECDSNETSGFDLEIYEKCMKTNQRPLQSGKI